MLDSGALALVQEKGLSISVRLGDPEITIHVHLTDRKDRDLVTRSCAIHKNEIQLEADSLSREELNHACMVLVQDKVVRLATEWNAERLREEC